MTSMAAALAAKLPAPAPVQQSAPQPQVTKVPQRMEGVVDPEATREVESVQASSLVFLKIMKHSTDVLPQPPASSFQQDRQAPPTTNLSSRPDAIGVLLGLDLEGVMEVEDCFALPGGETSFGPNSYSSTLLSHLRDVQVPDSPVGIYLSTHNGGHVTRATIDLLLAVEKAAGRGKAILLIHDASRAYGGDASIKAFRLSEGARAASAAKKWDSASLAENSVTSATLLQSLPMTLSSPALVSAFMSTLTNPASSSSTAASLSGPSVALPNTFPRLVNSLPTSVPSYINDTLDALTLHAHESNNIAFLSRQIGREKARHESTVKEREEENFRRKKQGLTELPAIGPEVRGGTKEPSRLELLCLQGQVDGLARNLGAEAGVGAVRCYL